jgi:hypothetical protein
MPAPTPTPTAARAAQHTCAACAQTRTRLEAGPCPSCGRCEACCPGCGHVPHRNRRGAGALTFHGEATGLFPRYMGVEIECAVTRLQGGALQAAAEHWDAEIVSDGSLNEGMGTPREVVTAPARGDAFEAQVRDLCAAIKRHAGVVDKSCGLHVHVDARGATYHDLARLARTWTKCESGLYNLVAPSRRKARYCRAWGQTFERAGVFLADTLESKTAALDVAVYGSTAEAANVKRSPAAHRYHAARYRSLNFHVFHQRGTVEFRLHHKTVEADKILNWAAVCAAIVQFAFVATEADLAANPGLTPREILDAKVARLRGTPSEILDQIVPAPTVRAWMRARRDYFAAKRSRLHPGEPPRRRAPAPAPAPVPVVGPGQDERSEV